ncbi:damage-inducible protein DinB [Salipaludibacillus keqinensis]|uniref:Damage-inducible protein DinB n=1 Tax=Salipaludibacillus keqinensis TaxID=2045207 RepID=A0A323TCV8_9BACI|nr:DinB family protein [Salipaludibacillus keqinensis]PYZ92879.1 damage-inducible protein DinB [Salipaludibacillus keqinensis]
MEMLFKYNWQVREEWFQWCNQLSHEELAKPRTGGVGSILHTLVHIIDAEQSWINGLNGKPEYHYDYKNYQTLDEIIQLSEQCHCDVNEFVEAWTSELESKKFYEFTYGEVMRHVIAHEIHHIGQLSIWARELGKKPVSANLIRRGLAT